ncbi:MAG TPA: transposase [Ktedonosporobacter sp.]|nr:transposase [Ktedonosporobacter sp.]
MAKAISTIKETLNYQPQYAQYFAANQALFNRVVAFYFDCIQAHEGILDLPNKEALTALEKLTHATVENPVPIMPVYEIAPDIPALFRRAAINAALGSAHSFSSSLKKWRTRKEQHEARPARTGTKKKPFPERPPVPPRSWKKLVPFYAGLWKERQDHSILLKVWTGSCWSWVKVRTLGRLVPAGYVLGSPQLILHGNQWWLHTSIEKTFTAPPKIAEQVTNPQTKICAVDLNLGEHIAVCSVQTVEGTILATRFIGGGRAISGFRKKLLGRIARHRSQTGIIAENEQDNADLWRKIRKVDEHIAHLVSARIVQFAAAHQASILVFEHLGNLKPEKGKYSHRGNSKRAYWMKGRIFKYARYKAWNQKILTSRVNPRNTSRECHRCHAQIIRYNTGEPVEGYTPGGTLVLCQQCQMRGHSDRNASLVIGQRLIARYQEPSKEKPHTAVRRGGRASKETGVTRSQDAKRKKGPSISHARQGDGNEHGTAQGKRHRMGSPFSATPHQLRLPLE